MFSSCFVSSDSYLIPIINNCILTNQALNSETIYTIHNPSILILLQRVEFASQVKREIEKLTTGTDVILGTAIPSEPTANEIDTYTSRGADILIATTGRLMDYLERDNCHVRF